MNKINEMIAGLVFVFVIPFAVFTCTEPVVQAVLAVGYLAFMVEVFDRARQQYRIKRITK